uniref:Uncharacterized protein n=1 Tax=Ascaris lumbricoides TaxID=6252 RepID=A0A0M3HQZ9_ASCLU
MATAANECYEKLSRIITQREAANGAPSRNGAHTHTHTAGSGLLREATRVPSTIPLASRSERERKPKCALPFMPTRRVLLPYVKCTLSATPTPPCFLLINTRLGHANLHLYLSCS